MSEKTLAVSIELERYEELIVKEAMFDKLMEGKDLSIYPYVKVKEVSDNA